MIERAEKYFKDVLTELYSIESELNNTTHLDDIRVLAVRACSLLYNPCSPLAISFDYLVGDNSGKLDISNREKLYRLELILFEFSAVEFNYEYKKTNSKYGRLVEAVIGIMFKKDWWSTDHYIENKQSLYNYRSTKNLSKKTREILNEIKNFIQVNILDTIIYKTYTKFEKINKELSSYELEYYQKWIDNSITYKDLSRNTHYDINEYVSDQKLDFEICEQIDKKKEELFKEGVSTKLQGLINDLSEISKGKRAQTISTHKQLLKTFLQGDTSQLLIERLNVFLKITEPEQVILQYDKLLHSEYYNHYELNVFEPKKFRQHSAVFNAHLIYGYLKVLNNPKTIPDDYEVEFEDTIIETTRLSFKFNSEASKLSSAISSLQFKIELLKDDTQIEYLIDVLTTDDLSEYEDKITIGCDTKQFAYVLTSLKPYFNNLTMVSVEDCNLFKSKNGNYIKANSLYSKDQMKPKKSADIDIAINQMK